MFILKNIIPKESPDTDNSEILRIIFEINALFNIHFKFKAFLQDKPTFRNFFAFISGLPHDFLLDRRESFSNSATPQITSKFYLYFTVIIEIY